MELGLKVIRGVPEEGRVVPVPTGARLLVGRWPPEQGIGLTLLSPEINRKHFEVWRDERGVWLLDLTIRGNSRLNGVQIPPQDPPKAPTALRPCDRLQVGPAILRVVVLGQADPAWLAWQGGTVASLARGVLERGGAGQGPVLHDALLEDSQTQELRRSVGARLPGLAGDDPACRQWAGNPVCRGRRGRLLRAEHRLPEIIQRPFIPGLLEDSMNLAIRGRSCFSPVGGDVAPECEGMHPRPREKVFKASG
jgi:hypothetical protein